MITEWSVLVLSMLDAEEISRCKDLSDFDKGQIIMVRQLGRSISAMAKTCGMLLASNGEYSGPRRDEP